VVAEPAHKRAQSPKAESSLSGPDSQALSDSERTGPQRSENPEAITLQEVVITGTLIRGGITPSPTIQLDRDTFTRAADTTVADAISHLTQNFGGGANVLPQGSPGREQQFNSGYGSGLNLRGLGSDATLVLLNGRRTAASGFGVFVDLS